MLSPARALALAAVAVLAPAAPASADLVLTNSFVSAKGWVKPGDAFPLTVKVTNTGAGGADGGVVTIPPAEGMRFTAVKGGDGASIAGGAVTWKVGAVPAGGERRLVLEAKADALTADPEVVWRDLSTTATGTASPAPAASHGPKVIPPSEAFETARYGDRPFPVVPVDFSDRKHAAGMSAALLSAKINDPATPGSTFNLYQEMSYGQLYPQGDVPSLEIAGAGWDYAPGFDFTRRALKVDTCLGMTGTDLPGDTYQTLNPKRIVDGWYQLPGDTGYYGSDSNGSALLGAELGLGALQKIDSGCGPTGKAVYDAAQIADPDIDYDDFDTDKDGLVDFFMMIYAGVGGNGVSQLSAFPPYDNIWPHSSSLEDSYVDPATGLPGYISDDQATNDLGQPLWYTDTSFTNRTTTDMGDALKAHTRVGPYNVNPETAITKASVISHEYGHSLGLPDFYSTGSRSTYGTWNLMAEDHSQHMDIFSRQDLGWVVPRLLEPGSTDVKDFRDSTIDTHRIDWRTPSGEAYSHRGPGVRNGQAYMAKLPPREIIAPDKVPSGSHLFWSTSGNDFGCPPSKGRNLDIALPGLEDVPAGTPVTLTFKSAWQIEWDFDYGFVLTSVDGGKSYQSHASKKGYSSSKAENSNGVPCLEKYGNGLTGSSFEHAQGVPALARLLGDYGEHPFFVDDEYDISALAGRYGVLRFAYATDPGLAKLGWFIDDVVVKAGDRVIYSSDFETANDTAIYPGGCREDLQTATTCTKGWSYISSVDGSPADHAYYVELRDRAGFDADGHGEDDRGNGPTFEPGLSLVYTDENHGYGNVGADDPPAQSPLDAVPEPGSSAPNLDDAAFTAAEGRSAFSDAAPGRVDNYTDPSREDGAWRFDFACLSFTVRRMAGAEVGPVQAPGDLNADVGFTAGDGCGAFDFGYGTAAAGPPVRPSGRTVSCPARPSRSLVRVSGRRVRFGGPVTVRRVGGARVFGASRRSTWAGAAVPDGLYVARVGAGKRIMTVGLLRRGGRWSMLGVVARSRCGFVRALRVSGPVFAAKGLRISYRLARRARARVAVLRKKRVVRRYRAATKARTLRFRTARPGAYTVVLTAKAGDRSVVARLRARRR